MRVTLFGAVAALAVFCSAANNLTQGATDELKQAAKTIAQDLMKNNDPNDPLHVITQGPSDGYTGVFGDAALLYSAMIDYWQRTGDSAHNDAVATGILAQRGPHDDYSQLVSKGSWTEQAARWGLTAMAAAEHKLPHPGKEKGPSWLALADNVFNRLVKRWDNKYCGGVMYVYNDSNDSNDALWLDTSMTTGYLFNLGARLARFTGNATYADWANKAWDFMQSSGRIEKDYWINYGHTQAGTNCSDISEYEFGHTTALFAMGAAALYDSKHDADKWRPHIQQLVSRGLFVFMHDKLLRDSHCGALSAPSACDEERRRSVAVFAPWFAATAQMAPFVYDEMLPSLQYSGQEAGQQCVDVRNATASVNDCFLVAPNFEGNLTFGPVEKIAALGLVSAALVTNDTKLATESEEDKKNNDSKSGATQVTATTALMLLLAVLVACLGGCED